MKYDYRNVVNDNSSYKFLIFLNCSSTFQIFIFKRHDQYTTTTINHIISIIFLKINNTCAQKDLGWGGGKQEQ